MIRRHWWTGAEIAFLRRHLAKMGRRWCAAHFGVSIHSIQALATRHGIAGPYSIKVRHRWTGRDIATLRRYYPKLGPRGCAFLIGTTPRGAAKYASRHGIRFTGRHGFGRRPKVQSILQRAWRTSA
jgi:hypothetical protein